VHERLLTKQAFATTRASICTAYIDLNQKYQPVGDAQNDPAAQAPGKKTRKLELHAKPISAQNGDRIAANLAVEVGDGSFASKAAEAVRPFTSATPPKADVNSPHIAA
jgi:hypothetical protein